jgi:hypothetical protein
MTAVGADKTGARIGFIGVLLGALIGGIGSFAGAYFSTDAQRDLAITSERRATFARLLTAGQEHATALAVLDKAVESKDVRNYPALSKAVLDARRAQYARLVDAVLIISSADSEERQVMDEPYSILFDIDTPPELTDFD